MTSTIPYRYSKQRVIGHGKFGVVYLYTDMGTGTNVVLKTCAQHEDDTVLRNEINIYNYLYESDTHANRHILNYFWFGYYNRLPYIIIEYMPQTLATRKSVNLRRAIPTMMQSIQFLHENGIIHRDIKPDNFMMCGNSIKLGDFGLSTCYQNVPYSKTKASIGSPPFMSIHVHKCTRPSRRDDIESFIYTVAYIAYGCRLPWGHVSDESSIQQEKRKWVHSSDMLLQRIALSVHNLRFNECPSYAELEAQLLQAI